MKISIVATAVFSLAASAAANIVLPADETPATRDATTNRLIEMAMADGNKELLDHLNAFSALKEEGALIEDQRRRLHGRDDADLHGRKLAKSSSSSSKCFYGFATEAFTYDYPQSNTYTFEDSDTFGPTGRIYWWGTNAVCDDESTDAITYVPTNPYFDTQIQSPSYCASLPENNYGYENAQQIGSATGHCFISPVYVNSDGFGGDDRKCDIGRNSICAWSCQEVLVINNDYIFMEYIFQPNPGSQSFEPTSEPTSTFEPTYEPTTWTYEPTPEWTSEPTFENQGDFPNFFDVVVTGGTGCYNVKQPTIINGYTAYGTEYFVYNLKDIKNGQKSAKSSRRRWFGGSF